MAPVSADDRIGVQGEFTAQIDPATFSFTPIGANCLLGVDGVLEFTGTLAGFAFGTTKALVFAACEEVQDVETNPPGTFEDLFRSDLVFFGTTRGRPLVADFTYQGRTSVGGSIDAVCCCRTAPAESYECTRKQRSVALTKGL